MKGIALKRVGLKRVALSILILATILALSGCGAKTAQPAPPAQQPAEIIVSAAASLTDVLKELQTGFEATNKSVKLRFNFGSSGALLQQIEAGAPVDIFIAAAREPMDELGRKGLVEGPAVKVLATNKVVLIGSRSAGEAAGSWDDLKTDRVRKIALGDPQHVPAGQYGKAVLEKLHLWGDVRKKLVLGEDVRQVLNYVQAGEVQAGIVYSTDAATSPNVDIVAEAPAGSHAPVVYPMAVLKNSKNAEAAQAFADYLLSPQGREVLTKSGFGSAD
ncbi:MAG: molybdate ABC transporter substrate-binding protein [Firmicutes bacterium]|nr:molybdate ABC transporter substrate-binding protein [Bacillota bacterium]